MRKEEKAVIILNSMDITAFEDNDTVYVVIGDTNLEIAVYEIEYQANRYDEMIKEDPNCF